MNLYRYSCNGVITPSVSTILKSDSKYKTYRQSLGASSAFNTRKDIQARQRGVEVHSAARKFLRTGEVDLPEQYFPYWNNIYKSLALLEPRDVLWADGPNVEKLQHLQQGEHSAVWNSKYKYCGCPDFVAKCNGVSVLGEFKTSDTLFDSTYKMNFHEYGSFFKYHQASMQLAGYVKAFEQTTGIRIDAGVIIVGTPSDSQLFILEKPQLKKALTKFHKLARDFHKADSFVQPQSAKELAAV